jgi:hypothetical protein
MASWRALPRVGFIVTNLSWSKNVVRFYNHRGTAEQWIKEGKNALPKPAHHRTMTTLWEKLIEIGAKVVHARYIIFQMAEVAVSQELFEIILENIRRLRLPVEASG